MANTVYAHYIVINLRGVKRPVAELKTLPGLPGVLASQAPSLHIHTPDEYTLFDVIQMIRLLTGYSDKYPWQATLTLGDYEPHNEMILKLKGKKIDEIKLSEFATVQNQCYINYGPMKFDINNKGGNSARNQSKKYPVMYLKKGFFPPESEYESGKIFENMDRLSGKEELKELDEQLKNFFKNRLKKPDEYICHENIECRIGTG